MKLNDSTPVLAALGLSLVVGVAIAASGSASLVRDADRLAPIGALWVEAIRMTVIPLVVSLLITAIASAADRRATGRVGMRTLATFIGLSLAMAVVMIPLLLGIFAFWPAGSAAALPGGTAAAAPAGVPPTFSEWLTSLIPVNPVAAAAHGDMLQLVIFAVLLALAITRISAAGREPLLAFFGGLRDAMLVLVRWIIGLAPVGVIGLVVPLAAHAGTGMAGAVGLYVAIYIAGCLAGLLLLYLLVMVVARIPVIRFARAVLPPQLIAFSTSSSIAALPALVESADDRLGLPPEGGGFVIPLAVSAFHVAAPVSWTVGALFVGHFYGVPVPLGSVATVALAAVFLAFAVPGVPRGAFIMLAPLFAAIGLPLAGLGILIAVDPIPDLFATVLNATGDLAAAAIAVNGRRVAGV